MLCKPRLVTHPRRKRVKAPSVHRPATRAQCEFDTTLPACNSVAGFSAEA
jgi:hypothetical protein